MVVKNTPPQRDRSGLSRFTSSVRRRFEPASIGDWLVEWYQTGRWKTFLYDALVIPAACLLYWQVSAQGMRLAMPPLSLPLWRVPLPFLSFLRHWEFSYKIDLANVLALLVLVTVLYGQIKTIYLVLYDDIDEASKHRLNYNNYRIVVVTLTVLLTIFDSLVFFNGVRDSSGLWASSDLFVPIVASLAYTCTLVLVAFIHVTLRANAEAMRLQRGVA